MRRLMLVCLVCAACARAADAQLLDHPDPCLDYLYPAGARQGQTVEVELGGNGGVAGADRLIIDGPPGIEVRAVQAVKGTVVRATLQVAPDAVPGRRWIRVLGGANGLTNCRPFFVGTLPEVLEAKANNTPESAQEVALPAVLNGRIEENLDIDCYRFSARAGQRLVAAVLAHGMDTTLRISYNRGYLDTSLELLDEDQQVLATADDTLGLDPVLHVAIPRDGQYVLRLQSLNYEGSRTAVYRLTLGELPYPTHIFPGGAQRGTRLQAAWGGIQLSSPLGQMVSVPDDPAVSVVWQVPPLEATDGRDFPLVAGEVPETVEQEPNDQPPQAMPLTLGSAVHGRFQSPEDADHYRLRLEKRQAVVLEILAQRHWRAPVDTLLEVFDAAGSKLAENDDGVLFARPNHCWHEFSSADSWLPFTAPADGEYLLRVTDQNRRGTAEAMYRLTAVPQQPQLRLFQWPDAVPIWGPGSTAAFLVEVFYWGGPKADVHLRVEGLPPGWTGSTAVLGAEALYAPPHALRALLTITAPADAAPGTVAEFHVVGSTTVDGRTIERVAQPQTLYGNSHNDGMLLRDSHLSRAVVAQPVDCWLETPIQEISGKRGQTVQIPVRVHRHADTKAEIGLVVNGPTAAASVALSAPQSLAADQTEVTLPLTIHPEWPVGPRGIVVARSWSSDIRKGRPGPCTPIIRLNVLPQ